MPSNSSCQISTTLKKKVYMNLRYCYIKNAILGPSYSLSLVLIADKRSKTLNSRYLKKSNISSVLAFPLSKKEGEVYVNVRAAERNKYKYGLSSARSAVGYLFIHALLHLKGQRHGSTMESTEQRFCKRFHFS